MVHLLYEIFLISAFIVWYIGCQSICVRRPGFILCTGGTTYGQIPTYSNTSAAPRYIFYISLFWCNFHRSNMLFFFIYSALINGNFLRNISSWMPSRQTSTVQVNWKMAMLPICCTHVCNCKEAVAKASLRNLSQNCIFRWKNTTPVAMIVQLIVWVIENLF